MLSLQHRWATGSHRLFFLVSLIACFIINVEARTSRKAGRKKNKKRKTVPKANPLGEDGLPHPPAEKEWYEERVRIEPFHCNASNIFNFIKLSIMS